MRRRRWTARFFTLIALAVLAVTIQISGSAWDLVVLILSLIFLLFALCSGEWDALLPGCILIVNVGVLAALRWGWLEFPLWRIWSVLFASVGLGLALLWAVGRLKIWGLIPAGAMFFASGGSLATDSFWVWQRWLRSLVEPALFIGVAAVALGFILRRLRAKSDTDKLT